MRRRRPYRERKKVNQHLEKGTVTFYQSPMTFNTSHDWSYLQEHMEDTTGFKECMFNPCQHYKVVYQALKPVKTLSALPTVAWEASYQDTYPIASGALVAITNVMPSQPMFNNWLADLDALWSTGFREAIADQTAIINFMLELAELLVGLPKKVWELWMQLRIALDAYAKYLWKHPGKFWLAWNFCIAPTLKDIKNFFGVFKTVQNRLSWLREHNHRPTIVHRRAGKKVFGFDRTLDFACLSMPNTETPYTIPPDFYITVKGQMEITPTGWASVVFDIEDWLLAANNFVSWYFSSFLGILDALVYLNPVKVIWEAMPFSWLGDWVVRRADVEWRNEAFDLTPFKRAKILQEGRTLKCIWTVEEMYLVSPGGQRYDLGTFQVQKFVRRPGPFGVQDTPWRVPDSWYNLSILSSLISEHNR